MKRLLMICALALPMAAVAIPANAEVKTRDKSQIKFEGMLGRMMGMFGGKAAKEGVVSTTAVKGDRKATMGEDRGQIIDLAQEKIYDLDMKKKTYEVTTFDELRRKMREAEEKARKDAEKEQGKGKEKAEPAEKPEKEMEVDFDVKDTGQKKQIAGYDTHEVIMTITVREKGKKLEDSGGVVMTSDMWLAPQVAGYKEVAEFNQRYWKQLQGPGAGEMSAEQMAAVMAMYPMVKQAMERMAKEGTKLQGTPLATTTTFEAVKSQEQMSAEAKNNESSGGGGLSGMLARKMMKKDNEVKPRATIFTMMNEVQEISTTVAAADIDVPAGFKEKK
jgi:hypothetical protein